MAKVPLRDKAGQIVAYALVDDEDLDSVLAQGRWSLVGRGYVRHGTKVNGKQVHIYLHRFIMGLSPGDRRKVDHRDGNKLDNRRGNLRVGTQSQNLQNRTIPQSNNTSGHRGVTWMKNRGKWMAQAQHEGRRIYLGYYDDLEEAATVVRRWRAENMPFSADAAGGSL